MIRKANGALLYETGGRARLEKKVEDRGEYCGLRIADC